MYAIDYTNWEDLFFILLDNNEYLYTRIESEEIDIPTT